MLTGQCAAQWIEKIRGRIFSEQSFRSLVKFIIHRLAMASRVCSSRTVNYIAICKYVDCEYKANKNDLDAIKQPK